MVKYPAIVPVVKEVARCLDQEILIFYMHFAVSSTLVHCMSKENLEVLFTDEIVRWDHILFFCLRILGRSRGKLYTSFYKYEIA